MARRQRVVPIELRIVVPERKKKCSQLEKDLKKTRCEGLLAWP